jgi:hypothetical protein
MKKLITSASVLVLALACLFTSCSENPEYSGTIDTVVDLAAPKVVAIAYPGVNIVSWYPVASAESYELRIYENDVQVQSTVPFGADSELTYEDKVGEINDGVTRKYVVTALSKTDVGRAVYARNSKGEASCKSIMPPVDTKSLELPAYEGGYDGKVKTVSASDKFVLNASNIALSIDSFKGLTVQFPVKAYLQYSIGIDKGNYVQTTTDFSVDSVIIDEYKNNALYTYNTPITSSGTYRVGIIAVPRNELYGVSPRVVSEQSVEVASLGVTAGAADGISASWANNGRTARIIWEPSTFTNSTVVPASYYTVYRSVAGTEEYSKVNVAVASINNEKKYFVDDPVSDNTKKYKYIVVCTDGTSYATTVLTAELDKYTLTACEIDSVTAAASSYDTTANNTNDFITWTIKLQGTDAEKKYADTLKGVYLLEKEADWTGTIFAADFDMTTSLPFSLTDDDDANVYKVYTDQVKAGKAYLLVVAGKDGYADAYKISSAYEVKLANIDGSNLAVDAETIDNTRNNTSTGTPVNNDIIVALSDVITAGTDSIDNYTYALYKAVGTTSVDIGAGTVTFTSATDWEKVQDVTMVRNNAYDPDAASLYYEASYSMTNAENGVYYFKLVKKDTAGNIVYTRDSTTVNTTTAIAYTPSISAAWDNPSVANGNITVQFTKNNTVNEAISETHDAITNVVGYKPETVEAGITYTLYRATKVDDAVTVVFKEVAKITGTTNNNQTTTVYVWDTSVNPAVWDTNTDYTYVDSIKYSYSESEALSTANSYQYVVVASRADGAYVVSNIVTVAGAN